jgi:hypothetical protein
MKIEFTIIDGNGNRYSGSADLVAETGGAVSVQPPPSPEPNGAEEESRKGLPDHILELRVKGFFREPRTPGDVHQELQSAYPCLVDRVQMALLRLQRRRELRKATKRVGDQEKAAYVW